MRAMLAHYPLEIGGKMKMYLKKKKTILPNK